MTTGLVLTGGGARAAYQVGVLKAIAQIRRELDAPAANPFPVITGTSAGAINAATLACRCDDFDGAIRQIAEVWENIHAEQVYRADSLGVIRTGAGWLTMMSIGWLVARWRRARPKSLLDNEPLQGLLQRLVGIGEIRQRMREGHLQALAVTASSYGSGLHVTFYDALNEIQPWTRSQRIAVRATIDVPHLMASSAIPFVFPAIALETAGGTEWFGDGSMRQAAPISPAVHLGSTRILVIGAGRMHEPPGEHRATRDYPSIAQIAGHALSNIFLDALSVDVERLQRINATLKLLPLPALAQTTLRPIEVLVIAPSQRLDDLASKHLAALPRPVRAMLRGVGVSAVQAQAASGAALASYLLFESDYTRELVALGERDTLARRGEVAAFFGWDAAPLTPEAASTPSRTSSPAISLSSAPPASAPPACRPSH